MEEKARATPVINTTHYFTQHEFIQYNTSVPPKTEVMLPAIETLLMYKQSQQIDTVPDQLHTMQKLNPGLLRT